MSDASKEVWAEINADLDKEQETLTKKAIEAIQEFDESEKPEEEDETRNDPGQ